MDESAGLALIEELKSSPDEFFREGGRGYMLLEEYFKGLSKDTLRALLRSEDERIRDLAIWITYELWDGGAELMNEIVQLVDDSDPNNHYFAINIIAHHARGEYMDD